MSALRPFPETGPVLTWYGDDFTGAAAVMEVLSFAGLAAVLFLEAPGPEDLARFPGARAYGVAGDARSRPPDWMHANLPPVFDSLRRSGAPLLHYKVCSTFDSAPEIGSIGRAAEIGLGAEGWAPLLLAAPAIGRWQAFGNLFARDGDGNTRLDRHSTMSVHPVTPMGEADLRRHLAAQTELKTGLVDLVALKGGDGAARLAEEIEAGTRIIAFDVVDDETLAEAGRLIWEADPAPRFAIGSQGLEYALVASWRGAGMATDTPPHPIHEAGPVAVVSGSCAPVTAGQIAAAEAAGFVSLPLDPVDAASPARWSSACDAAAEAALRSLKAGDSVIIHTARGPGDPRIGALERVQRSGTELAGTLNARIGRGLGEILSQLLDATDLGRVAIAGGDTSSHGARSLGLSALTAEGALAPGAALLRGHGRKSSDGVEILLKGGQMGPPDIFVQLRDGNAQRRAGQETGMERARA